jgi:hypothetical protein
MKNQKFASDFLHVPVPVKPIRSIIIAKGLVGDLSKVVIIDSENNSADLYAHLGDYNVLPVWRPLRLKNILPPLLNA